MGFELDPAYKDVPTRIADFKALHPDGCLRPVNPEQPYEVVTIGSQFFIVYTAAAYRSPDDQLPGIGVAWEPFPGKTPYTKDSELQNAETSAWGRAIVAALRSESKAVASAEDVRNRQADAESEPAASKDQLDEIHRLGVVSTSAQWDRFVAWSKDEKLPAQDRLTARQADRAIAHLTEIVGAEVAEEPDPTKTPAPPDVVAEYEHEANQLGDDQVAALAVWLTREGINPTGMSRAQALAAIEMARELRSHTGPIDTKAEPTDEEVSA